MSITLVLRNLELSPSKIGSALALSTLLVATSPLASHTNTDHAAVVHAEKTDSLSAAHQPASKGHIESEGSLVDLEGLVGPVALYPDTLLAIVLPASTYPLQVVQADRYLKRHEEDGSLSPDEGWDDSIIALLNYPEVLAMMSEDIDWTWRLGEAVIAGEASVIAAIESFRDKAYAAGNLVSDDRQVVAREEGSVTIKPVDEKVIYVPYYEPERVIVYAETPVYHYHPVAYPVYYYPYAMDHHFRHGYFWGVTTAFSIGWWSDHLSVHHHSYYSHPYHNRVYNTYRYRHHSLNHYRNRYGSHAYRESKKRAKHRHPSSSHKGDNYKSERRRDGDQWRAGKRAGNRPVHTVAARESSRAKGVPDRGAPARVAQNIRPKQHSSVNAASFRQRSVGGQQQAVVKTKYRSDKTKQHRDPRTAATSSAKSVARSSRVVSKPASALRVQPARNADRSRSSDSRAMSKPRPSRVVAPATSQRVRNSAATTVARVAPARAVSAPAASKPQRRDAVRSARAAGRETRKTAVSHRKAMSKTASARRSNRR